MWLLVGLGGCWGAGGSARLLGRRAAGAHGCPAPRAGTRQAIAAQASPCAPTLCLCALLPPGLPPTQDHKTLYYDVDLFLFYVM